MNHQTTMSHMHHGLPLGLAAGAGVLLPFCVSWWTTFNAILLSGRHRGRDACLHLQISGLPEPRLNARRHNRATAPGAGRDPGGPHAAP